VVGKLSVESWARNQAFVKVPKRHLPGRIVQALPGSSSSASGFVSVVIRGDFARNRAIHGDKVAILVGVRNESVDSLRQKTINDPIGPASGSTERVSVDTSCLQC